MASAPSTWDTTIMATRIAGRGSSPTSRSSFPIPVEVMVEDRRFATPIETTAYFIVAEALTNVLRHAEATTASVRGRFMGDTLNLEIADDGRGVADDGTGGTGVRGLADRAQAIGGTLSIESPPGGGTTVRARLPLA